MGLKVRASLCVSTWHAVLGSPRPGPLRRQADSLRQGDLVIVSGDERRLTNVVPKKERIFGTRHVFCFLLCVCVCVFGGADRMKVRKAGRGGGLEGAHQSL